jgi:CBS domain-containing protein
VSLSRLLHTPPARREEMRLAAVAAPLPDDAVIGADEAAWSATQHLSPATPLLAVADQGRLVGVVSTRDVQRAVEHSDLGQPGSASVPWGA